LEWEIKLQVAINRFEKEELSPKSTDAGTINADATLSTNPSSEKV